MNKPLLLSRTPLRLLVVAFVLALLSIVGHSELSAQVPISFDKSFLNNFTAPGNLTTLQFGPDNRLYVAERYGTIAALTIERNGPGDYSVTNQELIEIIPALGNHTDTGEVDTSSGFVANNRQVTGLVVTGTATNPVLYVSSSDPREGGGGAGTDTNLDTNSGIVSRLTWNGSSWDHLALVRGLPRSEENHAVNGMALDEATNTLYLTVGGFTNMGALSFNFTYIAEYAYSAAILSIDLDAIGNTTYDLPTLDDPTRPNNPDGSDVNDPFGGNDGLNQARIEVGSPVQIYASGFRNPFDVVLTESGDLYSIDNGPNYNWGGPPLNENPGQCVDSINENDSETHYDNLHYITGQGFYGGHPAPVRANPQGMYANEADSPVPFALANPIECDYREPGVDDGALATWVTSTNGITEYTATNFAGQMQGDLLTVSYDGDVYRMKPDGSGGLVDLTPADTGDWGYQSLFPNVGTVPLDVTAQGDTDAFPGTIWVAVFVDKTIAVFEPVDFPCNGDYDALIDEDGDGFNNADEIDNGTDPCSNGSVPPDNDGDFISDLNDTDDDNDGIADLVDIFQIDPQNGVQSTLPVNYQFFQDDPGTGFFGVGFTGLMVNGTTDYLNMFEEAELTVGGTAGKATVDSFTDGTAYGTTNTQDYAFQWGVNVTQLDGTFSINTQMNGAFFSPAPEAGDEQGIYFGTGEQDNYFQLALAADDVTGDVGFEIIVENNDVPVRTFYPVANAHLSTKINLYMTIDPVAGTVQPKYDLDETGYIDLGSPITLTGELLDVVQTSQIMAVGLVGNFEPGASAFGGTWDYVFVAQEQPGVLGANPAPVLFGDVVQGTFAQQTITLQNLGQTGDQDINVSALSITGSADITITTDPSPILLAPGESTDVVVRYEPTEIEADSATLSITHDGVNIPLDVVINGNGIVDYDPVYRVNMGGPELTDPEGILNWSADSGNNPSPYANHTASGANLTSTGAVIDYSSPTLPSYTPANLFNTGRWDGPGPIEMTYDFPVADGTYEVRIYFAETFSGTASPGARVWDVELEGAVPPVFDDVDRFDLAGFEAGYMLAGEVDVSDGSLTVRFLHQVENPELQGIEIYPVFVPPSSDLAVSAPQLDFGGVSLGVPSDQILTLSNSGSASDPAITLTGLSYSGADANDFSDNFAPIVLQPGQSTDVTVTINATAGGTRSATLSIAHDGANAPNTVDLTALAYQNGALALSPDPLTFGQVETGASVTLPITLSNLGGPSDDDIEVTNLVVTGSNTYQFQFEAYTEPLIVPANSSVDIDVTFIPDGVRTNSVTITAAHDGVNSPVAINATAEGVEPFVGPTYRVNVGGALVTDPAGILDWSSDNGSNPSPYWVTGGNGFGGTASPIDISSSTIPANTPMELFQQERYDPNDGAANELTYEFPVVNGTYEVRLYLAELYTGITGAGQRVFDVEVEGIIPAGLDDIDQYALVGFEAGVMVSGEVDVNDGGLSLRFLHVTENPVVKAIEIVRADTTPRAILASNPSSIDFGAVPVSSTASQAITLTNDGTTGAPDLTISSVSFDANGFASDFTAPIVLANGESTVINVDFNPTLATSYNATLTINHDGTASPATISLTGSGSQPGVLQVSTNELNFGNVVVNATTNRPLTLTNLGTTGDPSITITDLGFDGNDPSQFGHNETLPIVIAPGESVDLDLTFAPSSIGTKDAFFGIVNDGVSDMFISVVGAGTLNSPTASAIVRIETGGDIQTSSTYNPSFYIENTSTEGQLITYVEFDISTAIVPDVVFDPLGTAGDSGGRCIFPDGNDIIPTGYNNSGDPCVDPFIDPYEGGYNIAFVDFADFDPGEHFLFGVDIDPISTKGTNPPGPDHAASVSGYELLGSTVTIFFDDGSIFTGQLWRFNSSLTGSFNTIEQNTLVAPSIEMLGVSSLSNVSDLNQTIRVTGTAGDTVSLLISEGEMVEQAGGGYDVDPFEINTVLNIAEYSAVIGAGGTVDIPITLMDDELIDGTYGGKNVIAAVVRDGNTSSNLSNRIVVEYDPAAPSENIIFGSNVTFDVQEGQALIPGDSVSTNVSDAGTPTINLVASDDATGSTPTWLTIPASVIAGDPVSVDIDVIGLTPGTYSATVLGSATGYGSASFVVTVNINDIVINITEPTDGQNIAGNTVTVSWTSTGGLIDDHIHLTLDDLSTQAVEPHVGSLAKNDTYVFTNVASGNYAIIVEMANVNHVVYAGTQETVSIGVDLPNQAPIVTNPGAQTNTEGNSVSLQVQASDPEGQPLTYSATGLPTGLSINTNTGLISGTIANGASNNSPYNTVVTVTDGIMPMNASFSWTVNPVPAGPQVVNMELVDVATGTPVRILSEGDTIILSNYATGVSIQANTSGTISQVQFSINGAVERTEGIAPYTIAGDGNGNYNEWNVTPGSYSITATPLNNPMGALSLTVNVVQSTNNLPPTVSNPNAQVSSEDDVVSLQIQASDPEGQPLTYSSAGLPAGLSINTNTGLISGTIATGSAGASPYTVSVTVSDGVNAPTINFSWTVQGDLPPTVTNPGTQSSSEDDVVSLQIQASDPEAQPLSYSATGLPAGLSINTNTGLISGTVATGASNNSPYSVTVTVTDGVTPVPVNFSWAVGVAGNFPPNVTNPNAQISTEGNAVSLQVSANDPEGQPLTYNATGLPAGLSINTNTGLISGTVATGASNNSPYSVTVTVSDGVNPVNVNFSWTVNPVPTGPQVVSMGLVDVATAQPVLTLTNGAVINKGDYPSGFSIQASTTGTISQVQFTVNGATERTEGIAPYTIAGDGNGNYNPWNVASGSYSITATPLNNPAGALTINITVTEPAVNLAPSVSNPGAQSNAEDDVISLQISANDPEGQPLTYNATGLPTGLNINTNTGLISGTVATGASNNSPYNVLVSVSDGVNAPASASFTWSVGTSGDLPPSVTNPGAQSTLEENSVSLQIQANDPEGQPLTYNATGLPAGLSINTNTGLISGTVATGASNNSPYSVTVTVTDGTTPVNINFSWTVTVPTAGPSVTSLTLVDAGTNTPVGVLNEGATISLASYAGGISIQADTTGTISQIEFTVNGVSERTEGVAPYTIAGDGNGNYNPWNVAPGSYSITATPLNNPAGALTVNITVTN